MSYINMIVFHETIYVLFLNILKKPSSQWPQFASLATSVLSENLVKQELSIHEQILRPFWTKESGTTEETTREK